MNKRKRRRNIREILERVVLFFSTVQRKVKKWLGLIPVGAARAAQGLRSLFTRLRVINKAISPKKILLPEGIIFFVAMFLFSFLVIALETIQFHVLLIVTNYLKGTFIISIAMLGIAIGSLISFYLSRFRIHIVMFVSSVLLFFSIILSYYNIINIGEFRYPYFLILPFIFASINISSIFAHGNSNFIYFTNLVASALGVIFPIIFLPLFKSESSMMILMLIPLAFIFIQSFRIANIPVKILFAGLSLICLILFGGFIKDNVSTPDVISGDIFEDKILIEFDQDREKTYFTKNIPLEFFNRVYEKDTTGECYLFRGDDYDYARAKYILQLFGYVKRWGIGSIPFIEHRTIIKDHGQLAADFFEFELTPLLKKKLNTAFNRNYDLLFMTRAYEKRDDGNYYMTGDQYDRKRARYLLTRLGHIQTIDLNFDVRYHESLKYDKKIFAQPDRVLLSEDSSLGRLEYTGNLPGGTEEFEKARDWYIMYVNGVALDSIDGYNGSWKDARVPWIAGEDKNLFIVGLSADGIVKSVKRLSNHAVVPGSVASVSGIEINPSILRTMNEEGAFSFAAGHPYEDVGVHRGEGRSFLENTTRSFDSIYLMNIHMEHGPVSSLSPEYFHTVEGTELLLTKLTDRGYVVYEEIIENQRGEAALYKMMNTIKAAMQNQGIDDPSRHIFIYSWGFSKYSEVFRTIIIKRTPFDEEEKKLLESYLHTIRTATPYSAYNIKMLYSPYGERYNTDLEKYIQEDITRETFLPASLPGGHFNNQITGKLTDPSDFKFLHGLYAYNKTLDRFHADVDALSPGEKYRLTGILNKVGFPYTFDLRPATDNQPFPYNVYEKKTEVLEIFYQVLALSMILIIPVVLLILNKGGHYSMNLTIPNLFMAIVGFGYMLVEIVLMQVFQRFIGLPTISLIVTLGGLLLFSGIGSFVSRFVNRKVQIGLVALIPVILLIMLYKLDNAFLYFADLSYNHKILVSILLIFPITFLMGIPFPNAVEKIKRFTSNEYGTLMFGVSGAFSTIGATSAILINVSYGYSATFTVGIGCYLAGLLLFAYIMLKKTKTA